MYSWYNVQYMSCNFKPLFGKRNFLVPYVIQIHFLKINRGMKLHRFSCLHFNKQHPMHAFIVRPNENLLYFHWIYIFSWYFQSRGKFNDGSIFLNHVNAFVCMIINYPLKWSKYQSKEISWHIIFINTNKIILTSLIGMI